MSKSSDYEYLDEERRKLWFKVNSIETELNDRINHELARIPADYISESKQASKKASEYRNKSEESKNAIFNYLTQAELTLNKINEVLISVEKTNLKITVEEEEARNYNDNIKLIFETVETSKLSVEGNAAKLEDIFEDFDILTDRISKLQSILSESDETSSKIDILHKSLLTRKTEIDKIYYEIFGYADTTAGTTTQVSGLKDKLDQAYGELSNDMHLVKEALESLKKKTEDEYVTLLNESKSDAEKHVQTWNLIYIGLEGKIEALLPNALTAGLSSAYSEKKTVEINEYKKLNRAFMIAIGGLILVSFIPFAVSIYMLNQNKTFDQIVFDLPRSVLSILPLYIPVLWVAYSSNRKMNLSKRLSEEYSHKEVLSKTFEGLSTQINNISDQKTSADLRNKLLYNILEVSSENPGKLISDYNKSDHPIMDVLDKSVKLATAYEKLEKIPGLSKLADKMNQKSKTIVKDENEKANTGLDAVDLTE